MAFVWRRNSAPSTPALVPNAPGERVWQTRTPQARTQLGNHRATKARHLIRGPELQSSLSTTSTEPVGTHRMNLVAWGDRFLGRTDDALLLEHFEKNGLRERGGNGL